MHKLKLFLIGIILFFISTTFIDELSLYQITPCILLPWVIYISINFEYKYCLLLTFFFSLALDVINPQLLGFSTIIMLLISHFTFIYNKSINKNRVITVILSLLIINLFYYFIQWIYFTISSPDPLYLLSKIILTLLYNTVISFILIYVLAILDKLKIVLYG
jgi:rod shape-determining protein MreD